MRTQTTQLVERRWWGVSWRTTRGSQRYYTNWYPLWVSYGAFSRWVMVYWPQITTICAIAPLSRLCDPNWPLLSSFDKLIDPGRMYSVWWHLWYISGCPMVPICHQMSDETDFLISHPREYVPNTDSSHTMCDKTDDLHPLCTVQYTLNALKLLNEPQMIYFHLGRY